VKTRTFISIGALLSLWTLSAGTLGFVQQYFSDIHFEKGKWDRTAQLPCFTYAATENGATVEVLRIGTNNLVPFRATKGLKVTVCGNTAAFDEGFETGLPLPKAAVEKPTP
jgi:hypothetical protein